MQISLLLGSGFSVPDGVPTVGKINSEIQKLRVEDIYIHSDLTFILLNGQKKPEFSINRLDELFFIEFIQFYIKLSKRSFNYEEFYDFIVSYLRFKNKKQEIETFVDGFNAKISSPVYKKDVLNYLSRFLDNFNKLLSSFLQSKKYYEDIGLGNYPPYDAFIAYLKFHLNDGHLVTVHSLNHDLLFEHIASKHSDLWKEFDDGFTDLGSSYYGEVNLSESITKTYRVRLRYFNNKFDNNLQLIKLHGSVDTYVANIEAYSYDSTRVKKDWGVGDIVKEVVDSKTGRPLYVGTFQKSYPDILTGITSKAASYKQPYHKELLERFKNKLNYSDKLIVIGYGFKDDGINNILENEYLVHGKRMAVVDIARPLSRLVNDYNATFIEKSVSDVTIKEWLDV